MLPCSVGIRETSEAWCSAGMERRFLSWSLDKTVRLWDPVTGEHKATLTGHTEMVGGVAFSPDGRTLVTAGDWNDKTVRLWDTETWELKRILTGTTKGARSIRFSPDGKVLVSLADDDAVWLWDTETWNINRRYLRIRFQAIASRSVQVGLRLPVGIRT